MSTLAQLRTAARACTACPLWEHATQTVFGEGRSGAKVMFVGEQPGDQEDLAGKPFVGPAGQLLNRALEDAGVDRKEVYVTNAVKHFKWVPQGKRRLHKKPSSREIAACYQWLQREIDTLEPRLIVCLGATAATASLGRDFKVSTRGKVIRREGAQPVLATVHPSSILRARGSAEREAAYRQFLADLQLIRGALN